jgi:hypothetical protein
MFLFDNSFILFHMVHLFTLIDTFTAVVCILVNHDFCHHYATIYIHINTYVHTIVVIRLKCKLVIGPLVLGIFYFVVAFNFISLFTFLSMFHLDLVSFFLLRTVLFESVHLYPRFYILFSILVK